MSSVNLDWQVNDKLALGRGATVQQFTAACKGDNFQIDVNPWGEGYLKVNGREIAHIDDAKDRRQAFRTLKSIAERYLDDQAESSKNIRRSPTIPAVTRPILRRSSR